MSRNLFYLLLLFFLTGSCTGQKNAPASDLANGTDYRLNDIWVLENINGKAINVQTEPPRLEFQLKENRVTGYGGCNQISGSIQTTEKTIQFGMMARTKMACPDLALEDQFLGYLNDQEVGFEIGERKLTLTSGNNRLVFKKVD